MKADSPEVRHIDRVSHHCPCPRHRTPSSTSISPAHPSWHPGCASTTSGVRKDELRDHRRAKNDESPCSWGVPKSVGWGSSGYDGSLATGRDSQAPRPENYAGSPQADKGGRPTDREFRLIHSPLPKCQSASNLDPRSACKIDPPDLSSRGRRAGLERRPTPRVGGEVGQRCLESDDGRTFPRFIHGPRPSSTSGAVGKAWKSPVPEAPHWMIGGGNGIHLPDYHSSQA